MSETKFKFRVSKPRPKVDLEAMVFTAEIDEEGDFVVKVGFCDQGHTQILLWISSDDGSLVRTSFLSEKWGLPTNDNGQIATSEEHRSEQRKNSNA